MLSDKWIVDTVSNDVGLTQHAVAKGRTRLGLFEQPPQRIDYNSGDVFSYK